VSISQSTSILEESLQIDPTNRANEEDFMTAPLVCKILAETIVRSDFEGLLFLVGCSLKAEIVYDGDHGDKSNPKKR
jgi:hypothetical protein